MTSRASTREPNDLVTYRGERVLVLGANGFIGRWVVKLLADHKAHLIAPLRDQLDLTDFSAVSRMLHEQRPAFLFNLAAYGVHPQGVNERLAGILNADLPELLAAEMRGGRFVHTGSSAEYSSADCITEESICEPENWYGRTKLQGTLAVARYPAAIVARLFNVYGPGEAAWRLAPSILAAARARQPLPLTAGVQRRDFTCVEDVADGLLRLGLAPDNGTRIVNLATGTTVAVRDFALTAARVFGLPESNLLFGEIAKRGVDLTYGSVSVDKLHTLTGWTPGTGIEEGLRRMCDDTER